MVMRVGVDFDNTIVSYDRAFAEIATQRGMVPVDTSPTKESVRDFLRATGREDEWTELQGFVYGPGIAEARPFPGVLDFFRHARDCGVETVIVSHKTRTPYRGPAYDLHRSARDFLEANGLDGPVHFELTKEDKLARIGALAPSWFIDDLPEFLAEAAFPAPVRRILFDPNRSEACARAAAEHSLTRVSSWREIDDALLTG